MARRLVVILSVSLTKRYNSLWQLFIGQFLRGGRMLHAHAAVIERLESRTLLSSSSGNLIGDRRAGPATPDRRSVTPAVSQTFPLLPTLNSSTLPTTLVAGAAASGVINLSIDGLRATRATLPLSIWISLTWAPPSNPQQTTDVAELAHVVVPVSPGQGRFKGNIPVRVRPHTTPVGTYQLAVNAYEPDDSNLDSYSTFGDYTLGLPQFTVIPAITALAESIGKSTLPASVVSGSHSTGSVTLSITNDGNFTTPATTTVALFATTSGIVDNTSIELNAITRPLRIKVGKAMRLTLPVRRIPATPVGNYTVVAQVTDPSQDLTSAVVGSLAVTNR